MVNPDGMFSHFYKQVARELAPKLSVMFRLLVRRGNFPGCWRLADVAPALKKSYFSDVGDYSPISITPVLSKVFENIVTGMLSHFLEGSLLHPSQLLYRSGLGTCDVLLTLSHQLFWTGAWRTGLFS